MDRIERYKEIVRRIICEHAAYTPSTGKITNETVFNDEAGHYELLHIGWDGWRRVHGLVIHVDIRGGKIFIQHDGTEDGIALQMMEAGIPKDSIVLAFLHPPEQKYTDFAVA